MKHLTVEEMIEFVSFDTPDPRTLKLASRVNTHIRCCEECRKKVDAFQLLYDEMKVVRHASGAKAMAHGAALRARAEDTLDREVEECDPER